MLLASLLAGAVVIAATAAAARLSASRRVQLALATLGVYAFVLLIRPPGLLVSSTVLLLAAVGAGTLIGRTLSARGAIVAFCVTIALVDLLSFGGGLTRTIIDSYREGRSDLLRYLAVSVPANGRAIPVVGIGDLLMIAALYTGLRNIGRPAGRVVVVLLGTLVLALLVGLALGGAPAMPFLAAGAIGFLVLGQRQNDVYFR